MQPEKQIKWLFLDLNSYFASVEQQDNPSLRGKPVAVVPMVTDYTCAIAASYEAKRYGIKTGTKVHEAKRLCPTLQCVLARHDAYVRYHHRILEEVVRHTPINKVWSIDELSSRLPPDKRNREDAVNVAKRIKAGIHKNVGEVINCSIGIAQNSLLAKIAGDMQKPDGLTVLEPADLKDALFKHSLRDLPGINVNMEARLWKAGINNVEKLYGLSPKHARAIWGSVAGERFWYLLHGYDIPDQETNRSSIGHSRILDPELRHPDMAYLVARRLVIKAAARLRHQEFYATRIHLSVRSDENRWATEAQCSPSQDNFSLLKSVDVMWSDMLASLRPKKLKKVSVVFYGLCRSTEITPDLFDKASESYKKLDQRNQNLSNAMDRLNAKYGAETIQLGVSPKTAAGFVGTKIAFSRVPEVNEFQQ